MSTNGVSTNCKQQSLNHNKFYTTMELPLVFIILLSYRSVGAPEALRAESALGDMENRRDHFP